MQPNAPRVLRFPVRADECVKCRMAEAKLAQSQAVAHDLTRAVRALDPQHPVLESLGVFAECER